MSGCFAWYNARYRITAVSTAVSTWGDLSGNAYDIDKNSDGAPTYSATGLNNHPTITYDGSDDNLSKIGMGGVKTNFSFWGMLKPASFAAFNGIWWMPTNNWTGATGNVYLEDNGNGATQSLSYYASNVGEKAPAAANTFPNGVVQEVSGTYDGTTLKLYVNNVQVGSQAYSTVVPMGDRISVGGFKPAFAGFQWAGSMSELAFYSTVFSSTDRANLHAYAQRSWFPLWEANAASFYFDGSTTKLSGGTSSAFDYNYTQALTYSAWIRIPNADTGQHSLFGRQAGTGAFQGYDFLITTAQKVRFYWAQSFPTNVLDVTTTSGTVPNNGTSWAHVVCTLDGTGTVAGTKIYINGVSQALTTATNTLSADPRDPALTFYVGDAHGTSLFKGDMNQASIFTAALSAADVLALYNLGCPKDLTGSANLAHWWYLGSSGDTTSTVYDRVGSAHLTVLGTGLITTAVPLPLGG